MEEKDQNDSDSMQDYFDLKSEPVQPEFTEKTESSVPKDFLVPKLISSSILLPLNYIQANQVTKCFSKPSLSSLISQGMSPNGFFSFYRGLDFLLLSKAIGHISNQYFLSFYKEFLGKPPDKRTNFDWLLISFYVNITTAFLTSPFDCILIRSQTSANKEYSNISQAVKYFKSNNKELTGLFRGAAANILFRTFGSTTYLIWSAVFFFPKKELNGLVSAIAATCATLGLFYPLEFLRIKMQSAIESHRSVKYAEIYKETVRKQGFSGLYAGFGVYCLHKLLFGISFISLNS